MADQNYEATELSAREPAHSNLGLELCPSLEAVEWNTILGVARQLKKVNPRTLLVKFHRNV